MATLYQVVEKRFDGQWHYVGEPQTTMTAAEIIASTRNLETRIIPIAEDK